MKNSYFLLRWIIIISVIYAVVIKTPVTCDKKVLPAKRVNIHETIISFAKSNLGKPYVYGKIGPESFDCSGFVYAMHKYVALKIPRTSLAQSEVKGSKLPRNLLQAGDLLFFDTSGKGHVNHSAIYLGNGEFIHASSGKAHAVTISTLDGWYKDKFKWGKRLNAN